MQERRERSLVGPLWGGDSTQERSLNVVFVPIDEMFVKTYYDESIPHLRAGDYPFVAIAKRDDLPLITEDKAQRNAAIQTGVPFSPSRNTCEASDAET